MNKETKTENSQKNKGHSTSNYTELRAEAIHQIKEAKTDIDMGAELIAACRLERAANNLRKIYSQKTKPI